MKQFIVLLVMMLCLPMALATYQFATNEVAIPLLQLDETGLSVAVEGNSIAKVEASFSPITCPSFEEQACTVNWCEATYKTEEVCTQEPSYGEAYQLCYAGCTSFALSDEVCAQNCEEQIIYTEVCNDVTTEIAPSCGESASCDATKLNSCLAGCEDDFCTYGCYERTCSGFSRVEEPVELSSECHDVCPFTYECKNPRYGKPTTIPLQLAEGDAMIGRWHATLPSLESGQYEVRVTATDGSGLTRSTKETFYQHPHYSLSLNAEERVGELFLTGTLTADGLPVSEGQVLLLPWEKELPLFGPGLFGAQLPFTTNQVLARYAPDDACEWHVDAQLLTT